MWGESLQMPQHPAQSKCSVYIRAFSLPVPCGQQSHAKGGGHPGPLVPKLRRHMGTERIEEKEATSPTNPVLGTGSDKLSAHGLKRE